MTIEELIAWVDRLQNRLIKAENDLSALYKANGALTERVFTLETARQKQIKLNEQYLTKTSEVSEKKRHFLDFLKK